LIVGLAVGCLLRAPATEPKPHRVGFLTPASQGNYMVANVPTCVAATPTAVPTTRTYGTTGVQILNPTATTIYCTTDLNDGGAMSVVPLTQSQLATWDVGSNTTVWCTSDPTQDCDAGYRNRAQSFEVEPAP
jgi:hypothetical protein